MSNNKNKLSIIVPIYNVENYLDKCLESIINQDDGRYELILVNDGSTDNSSMICEKWIKEYPSTIYIEQDNKGLGPARMTGVYAASGEYITFVDSDDWIREDYVSKMLDVALNKKSDIVYCDTMYTNDSETDMVPAFFRSNLESIHADKFMRMAYGYPNMWGALYNRKKWISNNIEIPPVIYEDSATYGIILEYFNQVDCCPYTLYYYRTNRPGSLMQVGKKEPNIFLRALKTLLEEASSRGILKANEKSYEAFCLRQLEGEWEKIINNHSVLKIEEGRIEFSKFLDKYFGNWRDCYDDNYIAIGSYASCAVYNRIKLFRELQKDKYQFTSLIDIYGAELNEERYQYKNCKNKYRKAMIKKILGHNLLNSICNDNVIIIDLINEITDIIKIGDTYLSKSEALVEAVDLYGEMEIISWKEERRFDVWKTSCNQFIKSLNQKGCEVYILELYLASEYGNHESKQKYEYIHEIEEKNKRLKECYKYLEKGLKNCKIITLSKKFNYTDENFCYGCLPEHHNEFAYYLLASEIVKNKIQEV